MPFKDLERFWLHFANISHHSFDVWGILGIVGVLSRGKSSIKYLVLKSQYSNDTLVLG